MAWTIKYSEIAAKQLKKMDKDIANQIDKYLTQKVAKQKNHQVFGKPLGHNKTGLWRYRGKRQINSVISPTHHFCSFLIFDCKQHKVAMLHNQQEPCSSAVL